MTCGKRPSSSRSSSVCFPRFAAVAVLAISSGLELGTVAARIVTLDGGRDGLKRHVLQRQKSEPVTVVQGQEDFR